ncbi:MAG: hypothetical protein LBI89_01135 [Prevotellaceae bacterium]|jgi:hypothetical protein|nr:hypothetical protein [Prevotellaceae bacterium]
MEAFVYGLGIALAGYYFYLFSLLLPYFLENTSPGGIIWFIAAPLPLLLLIVPVIFPLKAFKAARKRERKQYVERGIYAGIWINALSEENGGMAISLYYHLLPVLITIIPVPYIYLLYDMAGYPEAENAPVILATFVLLFPWLLCKDIRQYRSLKRYSQEHGGIAFYHEAVRCVWGGEKSYYMLEWGSSIGLFLAGFFWFGYLAYLSGLYDFAGWTKAMAPCAVMTGIWVLYLAIIRKKYRQLKKSIKPKEQS